MQLLRPVLFLLALLTVVELSFRVYLYGPAALHPRKMDSYNQIHHSGLVRRAGNPAVYFELRPDLDTLYKGKPFKTNSSGLRDREYARVKPDDTFRVAVLGSSWTMGSGVAIEDVWHSVMERRLNETAGARRLEFINFGVDQYGFGEISATLHEKALAYDPDLILVAVTYYTPAVLWEDNRAPYTVLPRRHPFFDSHALRVIDQRLGLRLFPPDTSQRVRIEGADAFQAQTERFARELETISRNRQIPVVIAKLAITRSWGMQHDRDRKTPLAANPALTYIDLTDTVIDSGYERDELVVSLWDSHPNARGHALLAEALTEELIRRQIL